MNSSDSQHNVQVTTSQSWSLGLEWSDLWGHGYAAGMAVGQPVFATNLRGATLPPMASSCGSGGCCCT